jgi:mono/diheme cytochrome c family protein
MRLTIGLLLSFTLAIAVHAQPPCRVIQSVPTHYETPTRDARTHRNIVRVDVVEVAQINPVYTSAYSPDGYDSATQAELLVEIRRLGIELRTLKTQLTGPVRPSPAAPLAAPGEEKIAPPKGISRSDDGPAVGLAIVNAKCAVCHSPPGEGRLTIIDMKGNLATLTDKQKLKLDDKVFTGEMPPPINRFGIKPITDAEYAAIKSVLRGS